MNEDDTFLKLKRLPLSEVKKLWIESPKAGIYELYLHVTKYHWSVEAYIQFYYEDSDYSENLIENDMRKFRNELKEDYNIDI